VAYSGHNERPAEGVRQAVSTFAIRRKIEPSPTNRACGLAMGLTKAKLDGQQGPELVFVLAIRAYKRPGIGNPQAPDHY
jgi:hypothetical protein